MKNESSVINLGCRLNSYESEVISDILVKNNVKSTTVINTCAVTNNAVQKSKSVNCPCQITVETYNIYDSIVESEIKSPDAAIPLKS